MTTPPKIKVLFLSLIVLITIGGLLFWMYYGDRGTLQLEGDAPDTITGMLIGNQNCPKMPCSITVLPGDYTVIFKKEGYYDVEKNIRVFLFETTKETLYFRLKPTIQKIGVVQRFSLPVEKTVQGYKDNQSKMGVVQDMYAYPALPLHMLKQVQEISFSPQKKNALILSLSGNYIFREGVMTQASLPTDSFGFVWLDDSIFYFWQRDRNRWKLFSFDILRKKGALEGTFYDLREGEIIPSHKSVIIRDTNKIYLFDRTTKQREEILKGFFVKEGKWNISGSSLLFQTNDGKLYLWGSQHTITELNTIDTSLSLSHITFYNDTTLLYGQSDEKNKPAHFILYVISKDQRTQSIFSFPLQENQILQRIETDSGRIYFSLGEEIYTILGDILIEETSAE